MKNPQAPFRPTPWTDVQRLQYAGTREREEILNSLSRTYRGPMLSLMLQRGLSTEDAEDIVQDVMKSLFTARALVRLSTGKGQMRRYLCTSLKNAETSLLRSQLCGRRDVRRSVPLEKVQEFALKAAVTEVTEEALEGELAADLLEKVRTELFREAQRQEKEGRAGEKAIAETLWLEITGWESSTQEVQASSHGVSHATWRKRAAAMRRHVQWRFGELVAATVWDPRDVPAETRHLMQLALERWKPQAPATADFKSL